jgi:cytochrome c551/c552
MAQRAHAGSQLEPAARRFDRVLNMIALGGACARCGTARVAPLGPSWSPASASFATRARRAGNGTRTRDPNLGKVVLYQLSYSRVC